MSPMLVAPRQLASSRFRTHAALLPRIKGSDAECLAGLGHLIGWACAAGG